MFACGSTTRTLTRLISFLKVIKDLMALTTDGRLFHKCAPTVAETMFYKILTGLGQRELVFNIFSIYGPC